MDSVRVASNPSHPFRRDSNSAFRRGEWKITHLRVAAKRVARKSDGNTIVIRFMASSGKCILAAIAALVVLALAAPLSAHPMVENALDVVIERGRIVIDARISPEQILAAEWNGQTPQRESQWPELIRMHARYLRKHLRVKVNGALVEAAVAALVEPVSAPSGSSLVVYRLEYSVASLPTKVEVQQDLLYEFGWTATCILRVRQSTQSTFETGMLPPNKPATFECDWPAESSSNGSRPLDLPVQTSVSVGSTIRAYTLHGIMHILTGYDHLLFVSALVLAATGIWDLIKVVSAFTLAHTLTLTLSVFNIVTLSERIVEPMIAASIVFVAVQNVFWPERSRGCTRLGVAFAFGLFHGLGFAGGLRDAMAGMPGIALWAALLAFSLGVELGHQVVVIPLYGALHAAKHANAEIPRMALAARVRQVCSVGICLAGIYFLTQAVR